MRKIARGLGRDRSICRIELGGPRLGVAVVVIDSWQLYEARAANLCGKILRLGHRTHFIVVPVHRNPGRVQPRSRKEPGSGSTRERRVAQIPGRAERLVQIQVHAERHRQRAGEGARRRLGQHRIGHARSGGVADQDRREIRRQLVVGLNEMTEVLEVAVGEYAAGAIRLEVVVELGGVDSDHHRSLVCQHLRDRRQSRAPAAVPREEEGEMPHFQARPEDHDLLEAPVAEGFRARRVAKSEKRKNGGDGDDGYGAHWPSTIPVARAAHFGRLHSHFER